MTQPIPTLLACAALLPSLAAATPPVSELRMPRTIDTPTVVHTVSGTGVHRFSTAIVHTVEPTATGKVQRSTETVDLNGDLHGRLLYHPTSVFDFAVGTLVNTGRQVFSGTVLGAAPVLMYDDTFRFEVNLTTGVTIGRVELESMDPRHKVSCRLDITGTGMDAAGDATFSYAGECRTWGPRR